MAAKPPNNIADREYQKFKATADGQTAVRSTGAHSIQSKDESSDAEVDLGALRTHDSIVLHMLTDIRDELKLLNTHMAMLTELEGDKC